MCMNSCLVWFDSVLSSFPSQTPKMILRSARESLEKVLPVPDSTFLASSFFFFCSVEIFSSTVPSHSNLEIHTHTKPFIKHTSAIIKKEGKCFPPNWVCGFTPAYMNIFIWLFKANLLLFWCYILSLCSLSWYLFQYCPFSTISYDLRVNIIHTHTCG